MKQADNADDLEMVDEELDREAMMKENLKIQELLKHKDFFVDKINQYIDQLEDIHIDDDQEIKIVEGRDIRVCIRARPRLQHEQEYFEIVHA